MIPEEYKPLIEKITSVTKNKTRRWEKTSDDEKFIMNIGLNSATIHYYEAYPDNTPMVSFEIRNEFGEKIDGIYISNEDYDFEKMWSLYQGARRNALKIEDTISNMISFLGD